MQTQTGRSKKKQRDVLRTFFSHAVEISLLLLNHRRVSLPSLAVGTHKHPEQYRELNVKNKLRRKRHRHTMNLPHCYFICREMLTDRNNNKHYCCLFDFWTMLFQFHFMFALLFFFYFIKSRRRLIWMASVFYGTAVVTVPDDSYLLKDILEALQLTAEGAMIRRRGGDGQIVATMPFETLPSFHESDEYEIVFGPPEASAVPSSSSAMGGREEEAEAIAQLLLAGGSGGSLVSSSIDHPSALLESSGHSKEAAAYIVSTQAAAYAPSTFSEAVHTVYATSVYDPRRTASVSLEERMKSQRIHQVGASGGVRYTAAVDRYRPSVPIHSAGASS